MRERTKMINARKNYLHIMQQRLAETSVNDKQAIQNDVTVIDAQKHALLQLIQTEPTADLAITK